MKDLNTSPDDRAPELFNDAELLGVETPGYLGLLSRPVTFLTGELWGPKDRRNTQDNQWNAVDMPLAGWIAGGPKTANTAAWGFSRHPVVSHKEGPCIVLGSSIGKARKANAMDTMYAMGIDIDSGASLDSTLEKLEELGLFCLVYTTHSHGRRGLQLKHDEVVKKLKIKPAELTLDAVKDYLREFDKNRYEESFIDAVKFLDPATSKRQTKDGVVIDLATPPLDKYRLIFPLAEPVKLIDLADTQSAALELWADKITGLAREMLGVHFDTSCTDPSRLFFTPRHPKDAEDWYCAVMRGDPLNFADVPAVPKASYTRERTRAALNPFELAGGVGDSDRPPECIAPSGASLNDWHRTAKERFQMADLLEDMCSDRIRVAGGEAQGHVHTECPFEHEHTSEGGTATMAVNALDSQNGYWTWFCHHDACQARHKLEFLQEALAQGWFEEDQLFGDSVYMMDAGEEIDGEVLEEEETGEHPLITETSAIQKGDRDAEKKVRRIIRKALSDTQSDGLKEPLRAMVTAKDNRLFDVATFNKMWREEVDSRAAEDRETEMAARRKAGFEGVDLAAPFRDRCDRIYKLMTRQGDAPVIFHHNGQLIDVQDDEDGNPRMVAIHKDRFKAIAEARIDFLTKDGTASAPTDDINNVFHRDRNAYPPLHRVISSPVFAPDMSLITEPGYHPSGVLHRPRQGVEIPPVPEVPTDEEVAQAKHDLADVLADFPLDGLTTRAELMAAVEGGEDVPSFCHALSVGLTPLCRAFIKGPTPGHLARKDRPRTGATKLISVVSYMATLDPASPQSLPGDKGEMQKTIVSVADSGKPFVFFDNLPDSGKVDFGELAAAISAYPRYTGRRLGGTAMVDARMDATWTFTGNRTQLSAELAARMLLINLDPKMEKPQDRQGFKYNLDEHVPAHAGRYLHALLVLVQNWKAKGCPKWTGKPLGGFETHSQIIGGILEAAGIMGFLGNRVTMQEVGRIDTPEDMLMDALIDAHLAPSGQKIPGTLFRVWGDEKPPQKTKEGTPAPFAGYRVVSIRDTLMDKGIALALSGYAKGDDGDVFYPDAAKTILAGRVGAMAGAVREWTKDREDVAERQGRYVFQKAGQDKYGTIYQLERLELID
ncbi:hypothetical protein OE699_12805 [Sedimentimonas flavescens]|uniref:Uncharacterized protein n=1 Tax=Sedimentimonas flavescens TaxID=2851012 RepID=A0ABT3A156_9RHOB|nr:hypothetical protein [Sedimentimonas flavescens]MCV2879727.1 hypothetical protein [Sedimentimonas flavescens]